VSALVGSGGVVARDPFTPLARRWAFGLLADPSTGPAAAEAAASAPPAPAQVSAPPPSSVGASPPPGALALPAPDAPVHMVLSSAFVQRWPYLAIAQHIQDRMRRAGWASTIAVLEPGAYQDVLRRRAFDLVVQPNTLMTGDPDFFYSYYVESAGPQSFGCGSAAIDALVGLARDEPDPTARRDRYRELAAWVARELPFVPLYHDLTAYAYRDHLPGFTIDAWFRPMLTRAGEGRPP